MSVRRLAADQPTSFAFTQDNKTWAERQIAKYPEGRQASAVLSLLWRAQKQNDHWLPKPAIEEVGRLLGMPYIRVLEIATFYTMFNLAPVGRHFIQMCGTTPCVLRGSDAIKAVLEKRVGPQRTVTADGNFSWLEVECLGACCNAPMVQINDDYYEDLSPENFEKLLDDLAADRPVKIGSQTGRRTSEPAGGLTSLTTFYGKDGQGSGQTIDEGTTRDLSSDKPRLARKDQGEKNSAALPDHAEDTETKKTAAGERTEPAMPDGSGHEKAAQAAATGGETHGPADKPGAGERKG